MKHQAILNSLAKDEYASRDEAGELLLSLASAYWRDEASLSLKEYEGLSLQKAAYVLELLEGFSSSDNEERFNKTTHELSFAKTRMSHPVFEAFYKFDSPSTYCFDDIAKEWGLARGAAPRKVKGFLDLQRRVNAL